jgi:UDP-3-O-[3-hydroxymyristoyl] N-acetylglucosamine deacetylase/3-hydroxyacyl-[acyl-carrier-protein] dehydratase
VAHHIIFSPQISHWFSTKIVTLYKKMRQTTIKEAFSFQGVGLHSGKNINMLVKPAPADYGYKFQRIDLPEKPIVEALVCNVVDTSRGTTIGKGDAKIATVEHLLAALYAMNIDNVLIEIDNAEVPILDGSAKFYVEKINKIGIVEQDVERQIVDLQENIRYNSTDGNVEIRVEKSDKSEYDVTIDFGELLPLQHLNLTNLEDFATEIAPCRTFVFLHELLFLVEKNLIKGGSLDNAIVFVNKTVPAEDLEKLAKFFNKPDIEVLKEGVLNTIDLQFPDEPARHKLLDLIGDMALLGKRFNGKIIATRPGHKSNTEFVNLLSKSS